MTYSFTIYIATIAAQGCDVVLNRAIIKC